MGHATAIARSANCDAGISFLPQIMPFVADICNASLQNGRLSVSETPLSRLG